MSDEPTRLGWWIMQHMADHKPPLSQAEVAERAGVSQSTVSRWIYKRIQPRSRKLNDIARIFDADLEEVKMLAGYGSSADLAALAVRRTRIATEIDEMLSDGSPIEPTEQTRIAVLLDHVIAPYRELMKTTRTGE